MNPYEEFLKQLVGLQLIERYEMTGEDTAIIKIKHPVNWVPSVIQWSPLDVAERLGGELSTVQGRPPITPPLEWDDYYPGDSPWPRHLCPSGDLGRAASVDARRPERRSRTTARPPHQQDLTINRAKTQAQAPPRARTTSTRSVWSQRRALCMGVGDS